MLAQTAELISSVQSLGGMTYQGFTPITQAIVFQDLSVINRLLQNNTSLATALLYDLENELEFGAPIYFASQLAARSDMPCSIGVLELLYKYDKTVLEQRDTYGRTALHFAVTGSSTKAAEFVLSKRPQLLGIEGVSGKTALHFCASAAAVGLLLQRGTDRNHTDKSGMAPIHHFFLSGSSEKIR